MRTPRPSSPLLPAILILFAACAPAAEPEPPAAVEIESRGPAPAASLDPDPDADAEPDGGGDGEAGRIFESVDELLATDTRFDAYVFYLHGRILETEGRRPTHPEFGVYEYDEILRALAGPGAAVISEVRGPTEVVSYAARVEAQIRGLLAAGVEPSAITVVGFSKGGSIALSVSDQLAHDEVGFVVLAACGSWLDVWQLELRGRLLSIYETSDGPGTCRPWVEASLPRLTFEEVELSIGGSHGAFYTPREAWLGRVLEWIRRRG